MRNRNNHTTWILIVVLVAVLVGYVGAFFIPNCHAIEKLGEDLKAKQNFIAQSEMTVPLIEETEKKLNETTAYNRVWLKHSPRLGEAAILLGKINSLAREANVAIDNFDPEPAEKLDRLSQMPLTLHCSGSLSEIFRFLAGLEKMPQTIWIKNVTIEQSNNKADRKARQSAQCKVCLAIFMDNLKISN